MSFLCCVGLHQWRAFGGESVRDAQGKIKLQWYVCMRGCGTMRARNKGIVLFKGVA